MTNRYDDGYAAGKAAASWVEYPDSATARRILTGWAEGDPEIMDMQPAPLSGEWAGESMSELLGDDAEDEEAANTYEEGYGAGYWDEVARSAKLMAWNEDELDKILTAYIICALWSSTDPDSEDDTPLDEDHDADDVADTTRAEMRAEIEDFVTANVPDLNGLDLEQIGHDFWLTRNGHGAGFWDRGLGERGDRLTQACKPYGAVGLYVGEDGKVYAQ